MSSSSHKSSGTTLPSWTSKEEIKRFLSALIDTEGLFFKEDSFDFVYHYDGVLYLKLKEKNPYKPYLNEDFDHYINWINYIDPHKVAVYHTHYLRGGHVEEVEIPELYNTISLTEFNKIKEKHDKEHGFKGSSQETTPTPNWTVKEILEFMEGQDVDASLEDFDILTHREGILYVKPNNYKFRDVYGRMPDESYQAEHPKAVWRYSTHNEDENGHWEVSDVLEPTDHITLTEYHTLINKH
jgi:hypothetical protein